MAGADLSRCNTLGLPSRADRLVLVNSEAQLQEVLVTARRAGPVTVLGGGSNVVLLPRVPGTVLVMQTRGMQVQPVGADVGLVTAAAGERWHDLVRFVIGQGWGGLENLALIPGSVGAAPIQNIGAYGVELADRMVGLRALELATGVIRRFERADCGFGYRDSYFKQAGRDRYVIIDVTLRVYRTPPLVVDYPDLIGELTAMGCARPAAVDVAEAVVRVRRRKLPDPRQIGNAGSFFKNPVISAAAARALAGREAGLSMHALEDDGVKLAAAQLIDRCGWKGVRRGSVGVWRRQALVLVNFGGASASELLGLSETIRRDVQARFGVELELEPRVLGQD